MYDKASKSELIRIAAELKSTADRLLDLCKEKKDDEDDKDEDGSDSIKLKSATLAKKMSNY